MGANQYASNVRYDDIDEYEYHEDPENPNEYEYHEDPEEFEDPEE